MLILTVASGLHQVKHVSARVVSQFETMATQSPPIHRAGGAGGALGNPIGLSGSPPVCRLPVRLSRRTTTGFPRPHPPPRPLRGAQGRIDDSSGEALVCG